jgi:hypothetical protein
MMATARPGAGLPADPGPVPAQAFSSRTDYGACPQASASATRPPPPGRHSARTARPARHGQALPPEAAPGLPSASSVPSIPASTCTPSTAHIAMPKGRPASLTRASAPSPARSAATSTLPHDRAGPTPKRGTPLRPPDPPPTGSSPARTAAALTRELTHHGITGMYTATAEKVAIISVTASLTIWTDGRQLWCTRNGQRHTWPVTDIGTAAARIAALASPARDT